MKKIEELKNFIIETLVRQHGALNRINIERYLSRKLDTVLADMLSIALSNGRHSHYQDDDTVKLFLKTSYRKSWGQMTINSKQVEATDLLTLLLFHVVFEGYKGVSSAVRFKQRTMDALMEYAIEADDAWQWQQIFDFTGKDVLETPIDVNSLNTYIRKLENDSETDVGVRLRNLSLAKTILASLTMAKKPEIDGLEESDRYVLIQEKTIATSGRCYLKGLNLQSCPKEIRHAALGHCHLYDMRAGVFGVLAGLAKTYFESTTGSTTDFPKIKYYIKNRNIIRKNITNALWPEETANFKSIRQYHEFHGYQKVKVALTSIGFGAKRNVNASWKDQNGAWKTTSLRETFKSKSVVDQFVQLDVVKALMDEFKLVTDIILLQLKQDDQFSSVFEIEGLKDSQKLAMVYQGAESAIMNEFIQQLSGTGSELLLPAHDAVYISKRIDLIDLHGKLNIPFITDKSYIQFEHEQKGLAMPLNYEAEHRRNIAAQEFDAKDYVAIYSSISETPFVTPKKQEMTFWGLVDADMLSENWTPKFNVKKEFND